MPRALCLCSVVSLSLALTGCGGGSGDAEDLLLSDEDAGSNNVSVEPMLEHRQPPADPDEAWNYLQGTWKFVQDDGFSRVEATVRFTEDRKMLHSNSLSGGVIPARTTNRTHSIDQVAVTADAIQLTLAPGIGPGGVMSVFLIGSDKIQIEDTTIYTREK